MKAPRVPILLAVLVGCLLASHSGASRRRPLRYTTKPIQQQLREALNKQPLTDNRGSLTSLKDVLVATRVAGQPTGSPITKKSALATVQEVFGQQNIDVQELGEGNQSEVDQGVLSVLIDTFINQDGSWAAVTVNLELMQPVALIAGESPTFCTAVTWRQGYVILTEPRGMEVRCHDALQELTGLFCRDWRQTHPTPAAP